MHDPEPLGGTRERDVEVAPASGDLAEQRRGLAQHDGIELQALDLLDGQHRDVVVERVGTRADPDPR